jgi:hypothetical protein
LLISLEDGTGQEAKFLKVVVVVVVVVVMMNDHA